MDDYTDNTENDSTNNKDSEPLKIESTLNIHTMLKEGGNLESIANELIERTFGEFDINQKDSLDKFLDFAALKVRTGNTHIISMAYPTMRMTDEEIEKKVIELINIHLFPDIIFRILKFITRNTHDSDTNLYLAFLINSDDIIKSIYDTFLLFKKDIFIADPKKRTLNVKRIQQFPPAVGDQYSSPLDATCRLKYILEFLALKQNVEHIYKPSDLSLTGIDK